MGVVRSGMVTPFDDAVYRQIIRLKSQQSLIQCQNSVEGYRVVHHRWCQAEHLGFAQNYWWHVQTMRNIGSHQHQFVVIWVRQLVYTYESSRTSVADVVLMMSYQAADRVDYIRQTNVHCLLATFDCLDNAWEDRDQDVGWDTQL